MAENIKLPQGRRRIKSHNDIVAQRNRIIGQLYDIFKQNRGLSRSGEPTTERQRGQTDAQHSKAVHAASLWSRMEDAVENIHARSRAQGKSIRWNPNHEAITNTKMPSKYEVLVGDYYGGTKDKDKRAQKIQRMATLGMNTNKRTMYSTYRKSQGLSAG